MCRLSLVGLAAVLIGASGGQPTALGSFAAMPPSWAVVFQHVDPRVTDIPGLDILRAGEGRPQALTRPPPNAHDVDNSPAWSPDGRHVAFARSESHWGLYVVDAAGGASRLLARGEPGAIAWSPDGTRIAFSRASGIYVAHLDGSRLQRVLPVAATTSTPDGEVALRALSWSSDGRRLVCLCANAIYTVESDGSGGHRLSLTGQGRLGPASWSPDGRFIAYERRCGPVRGAHDWFCEVGFVGAAAGNKTPPHKAVEVVMEGPQWNTDGTVLELGLGIGGPNVTQIDAVTGAYRLFRTPHGAWDLTPGPSGSFAYLDEQGTLDVSNRDGRIVLHHRVVPDYIPDQDAAILLH